MLLGNNDQRVNTSSFPRKNENITAYKVDGSDYYINKTADHMMCDFSSTNADEIMRDVTTTSRAKRLLDNPAIPDSKRQRTATQTDIYHSARIVCQEETWPSTPVSPTILLVHHRLLFFGVALIKKMKK